jgi:hypothetical protein
MIAFSQVTWGKRRPRIRFSRHIIGFRSGQMSDSWIDRCDVCGATKRPTKKPKAHLGEMMVGAPLDSLCTDFLGPFQGPRGVISIYWW